MEETTAGSNEEEAGASDGNAGVGVMDREEIESRGGGEAVEYLSRVMGVVWIFLSSGRRSDLAYLDRYRSLPNRATTSAPKLRQLFGLLPNLGWTWHSHIA